LDNGGSVDAIYLDYAKAFDKVPHERLLRKLYGYGVRGVVLDWIRSFLSERRQKVVINGESSPWADVLSGVPQGSVLGPLLFVCYINDLPEVVHTTVRMFADDTKIFTDVSIPENQRELQDDINRLLAWADKWQLTFNADKCKVMHIGSNNPGHDYEMSSEVSNVVLEETMVEKDLGVNIDNQLKYSQHTEIKVNKANKLLGMIRRSYTYIDPESMTILYKSLIRPHLEYAHAVTYPRYEKDANLIEGVQRRATKMIPQLKDLSYTERLTALKLPSMYYRRGRGDMIECYKYLHGKYNVQPLLPCSDIRTTRGNSLKLAKVRSTVLLTAGR